SRTKLNSVISGGENAIEFFEFGEKRLVIQLGVEVAAGSLADALFEKIERRALALEGMKEMVLLEELRRDLHQPWSLDKQTRAAFPQTDDVEVRGGDQPGRRSSACRAAPFDAQSHRAARGVDQDKREIAQNPSRDP